MIHEARHTIATVVILFTSSCAAVFADSVPDGVPAESLLGVHIRYMDAIEDGDHGAVKAITSQVNEAIDTISGADTIRGTSLRRLMVDFQRDVATLQRLRERRPDLVTTITESFTSVCRAAASEERRTTIATAGELINVIDKAQIQLPEIVDACYSTAAFAAYCLGDYEINIRSSELHLDYCRQTWGESSWKYGRALFYRSMSCTDCYQDNERLVETLQTAKALMDPIKTIYPIEVFMVSNQIALRLNRERRYQEALHETDDAMALLNTLPDLDGFGAEIDKVFQNRAIALIALTRFVEGEAAISATSRWSYGYSTAPNELDLTLLETAHRTLTREQQTGDTDNRLDWFYRKQRCANSLRKLAFRHAGDWVESRLVSSAELRNARRHSEACQRARSALAECRFQDASSALSVCVELEQANNGLAEMGFPVDWLQADLSNVNNASLECRRAIEITWRLLAFDDNLVCGELISNELEMREMLGKFADGDSASRWFLEMALARAHRERREFNEAQQNSERARRILLDNGRWKSDLGLSVSADLLFVSALRHDTTLDGSKLLLWNELEHVPDKFGTQLAIRFALALSAYCLVESDRDGAASLASRAQLMLKSHPLGSVHNPDYGETFCNMLLVLSTSQLTESETVLNSFDAFRDSLDRKDDIRAPEVRWFVLTRIADYLVVRRRPLAARLMNELAEKQFDSQ